MNITTSIVISSIPDEVFSWIDNPDKAIRWQKAVKSRQIIKETPERIGTTFKEELEENGKTLVMYGEIKDYIPGTLITFQIESKIHRVSVKYSVAGNKNKTTLMVESIIKWKFPMNLICLIMGNRIKAKILKQINLELGYLKNYCETEKNLD